MTDDPFARPATYDDLYGAASVPVDEAERRPGTFGYDPGVTDRLVTVLLADVAPERVEWIWPGYLPAGKLVILDGDPGLGKSTIALDFAARVTTGSPMPGGTPLAIERAPVVLMSAEDGIADTIRPRFDAAGGDADLLEAVTEVQAVDEEGRPYRRLPLLPLDVDRLERLVLARVARLVIVDVFAAYLDGKVNSYRDQDVRLALHPLKVLAENTGATVLVLRHLNKSGGLNALYRGGGSIGITGAARAVLMVGVDPRDDTRRVLAVVKSNLAALPPSLAYRLVPDDLHGCGRIQWEGQTDTGADDLVTPVDREEHSAGTEAEAFLLDLLAEEPVSAKDVYREARDAGIAKRTLERAKAKLHVWSSRNGYQAPWVWNLPTGVYLSKDRQRSSPLDMATNGDLGQPDDLGAWTSDVPYDDTDTREEP